MKRWLKVTLWVVSAVAAGGLLYTGCTDEQRRRDACQGPHRAWDSAADDGWGDCVISIGGAP